MAINLTTLFTRLGKGFLIQESINTARGTTLPPLVKDYQDEFDSASTALKQAAEPAAGAETSLQSGMSGAISTMRSSLQNVLIETVDADAALPSRNLTAALQELIRQMIDQSETVDASTPGITVTPDGSNSGDGVIVASVKRPDGLSLENILAETISARATGAASISVQGDVSISDRLSQDWPGGSGASTTLTATSPAGTANLITNGDFDLEDENQSHLPRGWIATPATVGTTLKMTNYEVQRLTVTGPPTDGTYIINWTNPAGDALATAPLPYNATESQVQAALRLLPGLSQITVSTTGTSPLFTHDITFTGVGGNLSQITITNNTTGGTYTPSTVTGGSASVYSGRAVELDSNGSEQTALYRAVTLQPLTQYAFNMYALADVVPAAGVITVDLIDGIGGTVLADEASTNNSFTIDCTAVTTSFAAYSGVFRTPRVLPDTVFLRIRISTAISSGTSVFLDHAALRSMSPLYAGGPYLAAFAGATPFSAGSGQVEPDKWSIAVTNDRAGEFQEWFDRNFDMRGKGLILPSDSGGSETIADTLIG